MGLQLRLRELYARDETDTGWTEWGSDDMYLGAVALELRGPAEPVVHRMTPFKVGTFDDGSRVTFNPPRLFDNYGFGPNVFPKNIAVTFVLAEVDHGDTLHSFFEDLYDEMERAEHDIKALMAGGTSSSGGDSGVDWAKIAEWAYRVSVFLYDRWKGDEIFQPKVATFSIASDDHRWNGSQTSPVEVLEFRGHDGTYVLKYDLHMHYDKWWEQVAYSPTISELFGHEASLT